MSEKPQGKEERYYNGQLEVGDSFRFDDGDTWFEIVSVPGADRYSTTHVVDGEGGHNHWFFLGVGHVIAGTITCFNITVIKKKPVKTYESGEAYRSVSGTVYLRADEGWWSPSGDFRSDSYGLPGDSEMEGPLK